MDSILAAIIGVVGTGFVSLIGAVILGVLVPASRVTKAETRVEKAEKEAATWKASYDSIKTAFEAQAKLLERQQLTAEITDKAMTAVRDMLASGGGAR